MPRGAGDGCNGLFPDAGRDPAPDGPWTRPRQGF